MPVAACCERGVHHHRSHSGLSIPVLQGRIRRYNFAALEASTGVGVGRLLQFCANVTPKSISSRARLGAYVFRYFPLRSTSKRPFSRQRTFPPILRFGCDLVVSSIGNAVACLRLVDSRSFMAGFFKNAKGLTGVELGSSGRWSYLSGARTKVAVAHAEEGSQESVKENAEGTPYQDHYVRHFNSDHERSALLDQLTL